jgi:hypothetical protein
MPPAALVASITSAASPGGRSVALRAAARILVWVRNPIRVLSKVVGLPNGFGGNLSKMAAKMGSWLPILGF